MKVFNYISEDKKNSIFDKIILLVVFIFPLLFLSTFLINTSLILISFYFFHYVFTNNYFNWLKENSVKLIIIFFLYILFNSLINFNSYSEIFKSFSYLRFIILFMFFAFILPQLKIKFNNLFIFYLIISFIFVFDVIIQFIFGKNVLGFPCQMGCQRNSSFFQNELVAGTFILHFGLIGLTYHLFKKENKVTFLLIFLIFLSIFLTGDRSPFAMILIILINFLIFYKKSRTVFLKIFPIFLISLIIFLSFSEKTYKRYIDNTYNIFSSSELNIPTFDMIINHKIKQLDLIVNIEKNSLNIDEEMIMKKLREQHIFYFFEQNENLNFLKNSDFSEIKKNSKKIKNSIIKEINDYQKRRFYVAKIYNEREKKGKPNKWYYSFLDSQYGAHYLTAFNIFLDNFYFGSGLKTFRVLCENYDGINSLSLSSRCSTHPHNTHLEILSEFGIIGYTIFLILIFIVLKEFFLSYYPSNFAFFLIFSLLLAKFFPLLPSGSFFSSLNATYFWLTLSIFFLIKHLKTIKK